MNTYIYDPLHRFEGSVSTKNYWGASWTRDEFARGSIQAKWPSGCGSSCSDECWTSEGSLWSNGSPYLVQFRRSRPKHLYHLPRRLEWFQQAVCSIISSEHQESLHPWVHVWEKFNVLAKCLSFPAPVFPQTWILERWTGVPKCSKREE